MLKYLLKLIGKLARRQLWKEMLEREGQRERERKREITKCRKKHGDREMRVRVRNQNE